MRRRLELGSEVECSDGPYGRLEAILIDPLAQRVTHLIVQPHPFVGGARLVSLDLAEPGVTAPGVSLRCATEVAQTLPHVRVVSTLRVGQPPDDDPDWDIGIRDVLSMPNYDAGAMVEYLPEPDPDILMVYDRIPKGRVEIRHSSSVASENGDEVGHVDGLICEGARLTHLVLRRRHHWHKRHLTVAAADIRELATDSVTLRLSAEQLDALPAGDLAS